MFDQRGAAMLSKRQAEIFDFVVKYADKHGYPPTVREIGEAVGLASPSTVHAHLANLERAASDASRSALRGWSVTKRSSC